MDNEPDYIPIVLFEGYSKEQDQEMHANCSCVLIKGPPNIIIDTMTAWDGERLQTALQHHKINCEDIQYVICTHGHSDHIGCNYLFQSATHIVGHSISFKNQYFDHDFKSGKEYIINDRIKVIATPGHTLQDVAVVVQTVGKGVVVISGDLFEKEEDLGDDEIWKGAGSDDEELQRINREKILGIADYIVPGHGAMFKVPSFLKRKD